MRSKTSLPAALALGVALTSACAGHPGSGTGRRTPSGRSQSTVPAKEVAAWEAATTPITNLPPLKSLSPGDIEHAWDQGSGKHSQRTLLTAEEINRVLGWLRSAAISTDAHLCLAANPMPLGATLYLDAHGTGILAVTSEQTCTVSSIANLTTVNFSVSKTYVGIAGYSRNLGLLTSPGLARFLTQESKAAG